MNVRLLIVLSLALNVALGAVWLRRAPRPAVPAPERPMVTVAPAMTSAAAVVTVSAPVAEAFDWSRLAAADLKKYRDNLRAVGCPELTVRDIITAEVNAQFQARRRAMVAELQRRFWDILAQSRETIGNFFGDNRWKETLNDLNEERKRLLAEVLGEAPDAPQEERRARYRQRFERDYAWLPAEKRAQLVALEMEFQARREALRKEAENRKDWTDTDEAREKALDEELQTQRQRVLTPEEITEFKLRHSNAGHWARDVEGFEATETEWRAVATQRLEFDAALKKLDKNTPEEVRNRMEEEWKAQLKTTLGAERYAAYTLAQDGSYQQTRRITQRFGLDDSVAAQTHAMQQAAQEAAKQLQADKSLDAAARQAALTAIQQETQRSLAAALGVKIFPTYQKYNGKWLERFNPQAQE